MAEVAVALGVAAAIAQFVDIGLRCISKTKEVLQSADGLTKINRELRLIAADAEKQSALLLSNSALVKAGSPLADLLKQCAQVAAELTKELKWLQFDPASARKRDRARALWRTLLDKDAIPQLEHRLSSLRDQVCFHIVISLENHQRSLIKSVASIEDSTREWNLATSKKLDAMARDLQNQLKGDSSTTNAMFSFLATELKSYSDQSLLHYRVEAILKSLRFEHIRERESRVEPAHKATFHWVFDQHSPVNLGAWLRTGNGTYWIQGKAGSGKSTMMKFLLHHEETSRSLQQWANDKKLFIGSHFFWTMGTDLQKTQIGLLRTMLFQLLKRHPDLVAVACPDRLSIKNFEHLEPWTMESLAQAFRLLLSYKHLAIRMCFFIDGLDEYSGIHTDLVELLNNFAKSDCIKLCVSSRPWPEFREAYGPNPYRLCIHEFTRPDIHAFAHGRLNEKPRFAVLRKNFGEEADGLVDDITTRAEGVFLWVYYVVRSLLRGLSNGDDIYVLRTRVQHFPQELTDFFKHMFNAIDSVYKQQAAMLLKMLAAYDEPLPVFPLVLSDLEARDRAINAKAPKPLGRFNPEVSEMHKNLPFEVSRFQHEREILTGRCKDLIHAIDMGEPRSPVVVWDIRIGFLHRTVSDFVSTTDMDLVLAPLLKPDFLPRVHLLHVLALGIKDTVRKTRQTPNLSMIRQTSSPLHPISVPDRSKDKIWQCVRTSLLEFLRLVIQIHNDGDVKSMERVMCLAGPFEELSESWIWDAIFVPMEASMSDSSPHGTPEDNNNQWIAQDKCSQYWTSISLSDLDTLSSVDGVFKLRHDHLFRPQNIWQLLGGLGLPGYVTACFVPGISTQMGTDRLQTAREVTLGAFCRGAVLDDSEEGLLQLQYTERWNINAVSALLSWWALQPSPEHKIVDVLWETYHDRMLMSAGPDPETPAKKKKSLEMAKVLVANGAERYVTVHEPMLYDRSNRLSLFGGSPARLRYGYNLEKSPKKDYQIVDSFMLLNLYFGRESGELKHIFQGKNED